MTNYKGGCQEPKEVRKATGTVAESKTQDGLLELQRLRGRVISPEDGEVT